MTSVMLAVRQRRAPDWRRSHVVRLVRGEWREEPTHALVGRTSRWLGLRRLGGGVEVYEM